MSKIYDAFDYAIESGNIELFDLLAKEFDKLNQSEKNILLEKVVINSPDIELVKHIFDYGFDINYQNSDKNTLLHFAAVSSYPETVRFFLDKGLDIEARNEWEATPLLAAAKESDNPEVLKELIRSGADIHAKSYGGITLLLTASAFNSNPEIIKYILSLGFDIEETDDDGITPLLAASLWNSETDVMSYLVDCGANIRAKTNKGENLLHYAAFNRSPDVARYILPSFTTSAVDNSGESAIEKVLSYGKSPDVAELFLRKMKEEHILYACVNENPQILETLFKFGYDSNLSDSDGMTIMMMAAKVNRNPDVIRMLRYYRVNWDTRDRDGRNVLHYAASNSDPAIYDWMTGDEDFKKLASEKDSSGHTPDYYREHPAEF
ncbi:MAG: ankyrin repeat domain-containing protein [Treponema sp.]|nr:ankyrin repeat domain-containing protein [Treponema sp.]